jgi:hypothetical protein
LVKALLVHRIDCLGAWPPQFSYLTPFDAGVWWTYLGFLVTCAVLFFVFEREKNPKLGKESGSGWWKVLGVSLWVLASSFMGRDMGIPPRTGERSERVGAVWLSGMLMEWGASMSLHDHVFAFFMGGVR